MFLICLSIKLHLISVHWAAHQIFYQLPEKSADPRGWWHAIRLDSGRVVGQTPAVENKSQSHVATEASGEPIASLARNSLFDLVLRTGSLASGRGISDEPRISRITRIRVTSRIRVIGEIRGFVPLHRIACLRRAAKSEKCLPNFQAADLNFDFHRACNRS